MSITTTLCDIAGLTSITIGGFIRGLANTAGYDFHYVEEPEMPFLHFDRWAHTENDWQVQGFGRSLVVSRLGASAGQATA